MSEQTIFAKLVSLGMSKFGAAAMMGNMQAESAFISNNVENRSGIQDELYTSQVDTGMRDRYSFAHDSFGYGLCQWTYYTRKEALYDYAKARGVSIGDENMQLEFLVKELKDDFPSVWNELVHSTSVYPSSNVVLLQFERPAEAWKQEASRAANGQKIYDKYASMTFESHEADPMTMLNAMAAAGIGNVVNPNDIILDGSNINPVAGTVINPNAPLDSLVGDPQMPRLRRGDKGIAVGMVQLALKIRGYSLGTSGDNKDGVDCDFGSTMLSAVNGYKTNNNVPNTGTEYGIVNYEMWKSLATLS